MIAVATLVVGLAGLAVAWRRRPDQRRAIAATVAGAGLGFQVVHTIEHAAQAAAWSVDTARPPWLTPWAESGRDVLAVGGDPALGTELLHLSGNLVFLVGLVALADLARRSGLTRSAARLPLLVQGAHVLEHVALTATAAWTGTAIGVTTVFGLLPAGPSLWSTRVLAHFAVNAVATVLAVHVAWAVVQINGDRLRGSATVAPVSRSRRYSA